MTQVPLDVARAVVRGVARQLADAHARKARRPEQGGGGRRVALHCGTTYA